MLYFGILVATILVMKRKTIQMRVEHSVWREWRLLAKKRGLHLSEWIRERCSGREEVANGEGEVQTVHAGGDEGTPGEILREDVETPAQAAGDAGGVLPLRAVPSRWACVCGTVNLGLLKCRRCGAEG
jgi:hypothetical protein